MFSGQRKLIFVRDALLEFGWGILKLAPNKDIKNRKGKNLNFNASSSNSLNRLSKAGRMSHSAASGPRSRVGKGLI